MTAPDTTPSDQTVAEDEHDAKATHGADRPPTEQEEREAEKNPPVSPESAAAYDEAIERGAAVEGEGQIDL
jgi:hypothetical protein